MARRGAAYALAVAGLLLLAVNAYLLASSRIGPPPPPPRASEPASHARGWSKPASLTNWKDSLSTPAAFLGGDRAQRALGPEREGGEAEAEGSARPASKNAAQVRHGRPGCRCRPPRC